jgi:branched-chain amino acid transport system substrate-binding protein
MLRQPEARFLGQEEMHRWLVRGAALLAEAVLLSGAVSAIAAERTAPASRAAKTALPDIRIGLVLSNGRNASISEDIAAGLTLALGEPSFGIGARKFVVLREDNGDGKSADRAQRLIDAGVEFLVGPAQPADVAVLRDIADSRRVPLLVPTPGSTVLAGLKCSPYVLHLTPAGHQAAGPLGSWVGAQKPSKRVYLIAPEDGAARSLVAAFKRSFVAAGGEIVGEEYVSGANQDFSPYLAKLRLVGADSVYAPFAGEAASRFARDYEAFGFYKRVALFGTGSLTATAEGTSRTNGMLGSVISATDYLPSLDTPENKRFQIDFAKRFHRMPTPHAARGYDAGRLIVEALRLTGGKTEDHAALAAALEKVTFVGPRGPIRAGASGGSAVDRLYIVRERADENGPRYELIDRATPATAASCAVASRG